MKGCSHKEVKIVKVCTKDYKFSLTVIEIFYMHGKN